MPVTRTKARYRNSTSAKEQGNPLALALPERFEPEKFDVLLSESVEPSTWDDLADSQREDLAENIHQIRIATFEHYDLYCKLYRMMHKNYLVRNPTMPEVIEWSYDIGDPLIKIEDTQLNQKNVVLPNTTSDAIFVSGFSGNGKSTMTERILFKCFPQILEHRHREL